MNLFFKTLFFAILLFFVGFDGFSQELRKYEYQRELIWGITKATNGGIISGVLFKYGRTLKPGVFHSFGGEIVNIKHPKEIRVSSTITGNSFIGGKQNYLYSVRLQYGREWRLFRKAPQQGVQINGIVAAGPTIGLLAPYYVEYLDDGRATTAPYEPGINNILGPGFFLQGIGQSKIKFGLNLKTALSFEFGAFKSNVTGFEVGFTVEAFTEEIIIIPTANNTAIFPAAFISIFYGSRQ